MFKAKQILLVVFAAVFAMGSAAITFGARASLDHRSVQTMPPQISTVQHTGSTPRRHRRRSSVKRSKRLPNVKSLKKESW